MEPMEKEAQLVGADGHKISGVSDDDLTSSLFEEQAQCENHSDASEQRKHEGASGEGSIPSALDQDQCHSSSDSDKSDVGGHISPLEDSDTSISSKSSTHSDSVR
jgi:hypothetical protein